MLDLTEALNHYHHHARSLTAPPADVVPSRELQRLLTP